MTDRAGYVIFYNEDESTVVAILKVASFDIASKLVDKIPADACDQEGYDIFASIHAVDNLLINP
jgi:hypothetical protein